MYKKNWKKFRNQLPSSQEISTLVHQPGLVSFQKWKEKCYLFGLRKWILTFYRSGYEQSWSFFNHFMKRKEGEGQVWQSRTNFFYYHRPYDKFPKLTKKRKMKNNSQFKALTSAFVLMRASKSPMPIASGMSSLVRRNEALQGSWLTESNELFKWRLVLNERWSKRYFDWNLFFLYLHSNVSIEVHRIIMHVMSCIIFGRPWNIPAPHGHIMVS